MKNKLLYDSFLEAVRKKVPQHAKLANKLADILIIEKEAVYRRLRGEVPFTFFEIVTICQTLNISLDHLIGMDSQITRPFQLRLLEYVDPSDVHLQAIDGFAELMMQCENELNTEIGYAANMLPSALYLPYESLTRFYHFKWFYKYGDIHSVRPFRDVLIPDNLAEVYRKYLHGTRQISTSYYLLDYMLFQYLINDIRYFASIRLITPEEVQELKADILRLLDELERMAAKGEYLENENQVFLYVSNINFETNYCYFESPACQLSMIKVFTLNEVVSLDAESFGKVKMWVRSLKRLSTMISVSGERSRILFFDKQRELLSEL